MGAGTIGGMVTVVAAARLVLALALGAAAISKLASREATETSARELGLNPSAARVVALTLAPVEFALAVLLIPGSTGYAAAIGSFLLLAAFTYLIVTNVRRGNTPACACFGASSDEPISGKTIARNLALLALGALAIAAGPGSNDGVVAVVEQEIADAGTEAALAVLGLVLAAQAAAIVVLFARRATTPIEASAAHPHDDAPASAVGHGWPPGTRAPQFSVESVDGLRVSLADLLRREKPVFVLFTDPGCAPCNALLPEVADWQDTYGDLVTIALLSSGTVDDNRAKRDSLGLRDVLVQGSDEVAGAYRYQGTPGAVLIGRDGRVASRLVSGAGPIRSLFTATLADLDPPLTVDSPKPQRLPAQVPVGEPAPPVRLPDLSGGETDLGEYQGRLLAILFWSPTCGFCQQIRDEVRAWAAAEQHAQLVVVSSGGPHANALQGFAGPVLLEDDGATLRAFGATGTPSAVLVDASGRVATGLAIGTDAVLAVLQRATALGRVAQSLSFDR